MYKHILAATDGSDLAGSAIKHAAELAQAVGAKLTIVTVTPPAPTFVGSELGYAVSTDFFEEIDKANTTHAKAVLDAAATLAQPVTTEQLHVTDRQPYEGILEAADEVGADLVVMASHGRSGIDRLLLGSQAGRVLAMSKTPILVIK
jgi:nucleotide-binding universal stress UspA family protein